MTAPRNHHASVVAFGAMGGVIILGDSGSGKSRMALSLIEAGAQLVADDQVFLHACNGALYARTPPAIAGLVEMRGLGLLRFPHRPVARIVLAIRMGEPAADRLPHHQNMSLCDVTIPYLIGNESLSFPASVRRHVGAYVNKG